MNYSPMVSQVLLCYTHRPAEMIQLNHMTKQPTAHTVPLKKFATVGGTTAARKWRQNVGG